MSPIRIAVLDADTPVPNVHAVLGMYSDIFETLLRKAASTVSSPAVELEFSKFDCVLGHFPDAAQLENLDALLITGSAASAYDPAPWIIAMTSFIQEVYTNRPHIKIFGSCFGHQILAHALFSTPQQAVVCRDPAGWELGVHPITLSTPFLSAFGPVDTNPSAPHMMRQQFVHADHVVLPVMPAGFMSIGSSAHCALQGLYEPGRVLTYQGHAEFDRFINAETVRVFGGRNWDEAFMTSALDAIDRDDDSLWAAGVMVKFFAGIGIGKVAQGEGLGEGFVEGNSGTEVQARL